MCAQRRLRSACPVWSESSMSAGSLATHWAHSEDSDQTGRMRRLIWVFAGRTGRFDSLLVLWLNYVWYDHLWCELEKANTKVATEKDLWKSSKEMCAQWMKRMSHNTRKGILGTCGLLNLQIRMLSQIRSDLRLPPVANIVWANSKSSCETARMSRLTWAFAVRICDKSPFHSGWLKWAASWQNQQNDLCAHRRLRSAWTSAQSNQSLRMRSIDS